MKLVELGNAGRLDKYGDGKMRTKVQGVDFLPPEAYFPELNPKKEKEGGVLYSGVEADLFSASCILFWMTVGTHPFKMSRAATNYMYFLKDQ